MAYKGRKYHLTNTTTVHALELIKDFLVSCGWSLVGPTANLAARTLQDDAHAHMLGWFLRSNGEDGTRDLHLHLGIQEAATGRRPGGAFTYLAADIDASQTSIAVVDGSVFDSRATIKIGDETILFTGRTDNTLTGCTRGYGDSSPAAHYRRDVAIRTTIYGSGTPRIFCDLYSYRDLTNEVASSDDSGGITWTLGLSENTGAITGLDGYKDDTFANGALLRIVDGPQAGKMRVIRSDAAGIFTYDPFFTAPGAVNCEIVSLGWLQGNSRKDGTWSNWAHHSSVLYASPSGYDEYFYLVGNKDGFLFFPYNSASGASWGAYYGCYVPVGSPVLDVISSASVPGGDVAAGATTVKVQDIEKFIPGQKYRILSQSYADWINNFDRSADTAMGASPGDWEDLDIDELPTELVQVVPSDDFWDPDDWGGVDRVNSTVTFTTGLIYSYKAYAVIGEDPQPIISYSYGGQANQYHQFAYNPENYASLSPFNAVPVDKLETNPHHRSRWRCTFDGNLGSTTDPWEPGDSTSEYVMEQCCLAYMEPYVDSLTRAGVENFTSQFPCSTFCVGRYYSSSRAGYNQFNRVLGFIPLMRKLTCLWTTLVGAEPEYWSYPVKIMHNREVANFLCHYHEGLAVVLGPITEANWPA